MANLPLYILPPTIIDSVAASFESQTHRDFSPGRVVERYTKRYWLTPRTMTARGSVDLKQEHWGLLNTFVGEPAYKTVATLYYETGIEYEGFLDLLDGEEGSRYENVMLHIRRSIELDGRRIPRCEIRFSALGLHDTSRVVRTDHRWGKTDLTDILPTSYFFNPDHYEVIEPSGRRKTGNPPSEPFTLF